MRSLMHCITCVVFAVWYSRGLFRSLLRCLKPCRLGGARPQDHATGKREALRNERLPDCQTLAHRSPKRTVQLLRHAAELAASKMQVLVSFLPYRGYTSVHSYGACLAGASRAWTGVPRSFGRPGPRRTSEAAKREFALCTWPGPAADDRTLEPWELEDAW